MHSIFNPIVLYFVSTAETKNLNLFLKLVSGAVRFSTAHQSSLNLAERGAAERIHNNYLFICRHHYQSIALTTLQFYTELNPSCQSNYWCCLEVDINQVIHIKKQYLFYESRVSELDSYTTQADPHNHPFTNHHTWCKCMSQNTFVYPPSSLINCWQLVYVLFCFVLARCVSLVCVSEWKLVLNDLL